MLQRLIIILLVLCFTTSSAQEAVAQPLSDFWLDTDNSEFSSIGLEVTNPNVVSVVIEELDQEAYDLGLSTVQLREWIRPRFSQAGLTYKGLGDDASPAYLYVRLEVAGAAFSIDLSFDREAYFDANGVPYTTVASTWDKGVVGMHNFDVSFLRETLEQGLDISLNDYLMSNNL